MTEGTETTKGKPISSLPTVDGKPDFRQNHGCCRDFYCFIAFMACVIAVIVIFVVSFKTGEPSKLIYPVNTENQTCGVKRDTYDTTKTPYLYRPIVWKKDEEYCVSECPNSTHNCWDYDTKTFTNDTKEVCKLKSGNPEYEPYAATDLVYRCVPTGLEEALKEFEVYQQFQNVFTTSVADFQASWWVMLLAGGISIVLSFGWTFVFQCCGLCMVWVCILACLVAIFVVGGWVLIYGVTKYKEAELPQDETSCYVFIGFGGALLLVGLIFLLIIIALRSRINLAVRLIQESAKALRAMCCLVLVPIVYVVLFLISAAMLVVVMVFYFSSLDTVNISGGYELQFTTNTRYVVLFMVLMFFWVAFFLIGMNQATIAGAGAEWYFTRSKEDLPTFPIARALRVLILHHIGSVAVGSFLIALICTVRVIVLYLQKKLKGSENKALKYILACLQCCLGCLQKIMEFIASRAYIMMMVHGKSFFPSAIDALSLMIRNFLRTAILTGITKVVIFSGILTVALLSTLACILILRPDFIGITYFDLRVYYWWFVSLICFIIAFCVAYLILQVYEFLIDTIFLCFLQDEEISQHGDSSYQPYASADLRSHMDGVEARGKAALEKDSASKMTVQVQV